MESGSQGFQEKVSKVGKCPVQGQGLSALVNIAEQTRVNATNEVEPHRSGLWNRVKSWVAYSKTQSDCNELTKKNNNSELAELHGLTNIDHVAGAVGLSTSRVISSIPRAFNASDIMDENHPKAKPGHSNLSQACSSEATISKNWIYPSEKMFFDAMRRKNYSPRINDMRTIVPIHNAVNERAWREIIEWEKGWGSEQCGGPKLHSFSGDATALSPRARLNTWLGYQAPFDRHDWIVDRCGLKVHYIIDFYQGRSNVMPGNRYDEKLSFYLDVRPTLNSWTGFKMRTARFFGLTRWDAPNGSSKTASTDS